MDLLERAGLPRKLALPVVFLAAHGEVTSPEVEGATGLRQPEVSTAIRHLRERGWVAKRDVKRDGRGRPLHAYRLARPFDAIVEEIVRRERGRVQDIEAVIRALERRAEAYASP